MANAGNKRIINLNYIVTDIVVALIEQKLVYIGDDNEKTGKEIAKLFNIIKENTTTVTEIEIAIKEPEGEC